MTDEELLLIVHDAAMGAIDELKAKAKDDTLRWYAVIAVSAFGAHLTEAIKDHIAARKMGDE